MFKMSMDHGHIFFIFSVKMDFDDITYFNDYIEKIDFEDDFETFNLEIDESAFIEEPIMNEFTDNDLIELLDKYNF